MVTDENAHVVSSHDYLPFGEEIPGNSVGRSGLFGPGTDQVNQKFTGKERDAESGLDYFGSRYYGSALGRFTTADSFGGHYTDPQTLNLYAYVKNNPLRFTDPTGHDLQEVCNAKSSICGKSHWWNIDRHVGTTDDDGRFHITRFQTDLSGNLAGHNVNFNTAGIHIDSNKAEFISGTAPTRVNGEAGTPWETTHFVANSNCLGTCGAGGGLFSNDGGAFLGVAAFGLQGPNLGIDRFGEHPGDQYRGGNTSGPDAHLSFVPGETELPLHFDTRFPYGSVSGFAVHTGDLLYHDFQTRVLGRQDAQLPDNLKSVQSVPQP